MYLEVKNLKKSYGENGSYMQVLKGISTGVEKGEMCVIQGTSGSGKSTFLNCVGGLDTVESGSICVDGTEIVGLKQNELSEYRRENLGFIFQFYNLVPNLINRFHFPTFWRHWGSPSIRTSSRRSFPVDSSSAARSQGH